MNSKKGYSYEVDIWAIGIIMYAMIVGRPPFETKDVKTTYWRIQNTSYDYPEGFKISAEAKRLIDWILKFDPASRPSLQDIKDHPFFTKSRFLPSILPVECYDRIIPPDKLQKLEKGLFENDKESISKHYFEERNSQDYSDPNGASDKSILNNTDDKVYDLDELHNLPMTHRVGRDEDDNLIDSLSRLSKRDPLKTIDRRSPTGSKNLEYRTSQSKRLLTFRKGYEHRLDIKSAYKDNRKMSKEARQVRSPESRKSSKFIIQLIL